VTAVEIKDITRPRTCSAMAKEAARASPTREGRRSSPLDDGSVLVKRGQRDVLTCCPCRKLNLAGNCIESGDASGLCESFVA
jgi:hypothetical protein